MDDRIQTISRSPKLSDQVATQIQQLIRSGQLQPDERLSSERELADRFGVSRTVIREAVRSLMAKGLLEVKSGSGMVVSVPDTSAVAESMSLLLEMSSGEERGVNEHIFEVRHVLEVEIAGLAARRADEEDIRNLGALIRSQEANLDNRERSSGIDVAFHAALAQATHNLLFSILTDSISEIMLEVRRMGLGLPEVRKKVLAQHKAIFEAVRAGDADAAREAMVYHLEQGKTYMKTALKQSEKEA